MSKHNNPAQPAWDGVLPDTELYVVRGGTVVNARAEQRLKKDLLVGGERIVALLDPSETDAVIASLGANVSCLDVTGLTLIPGFVDVHAHVTGGGGEAGERSRVPEAPLSLLVEAGITTVVGILGTDSCSRSPEALLAKCKGLHEDGLTTFMWTGAYRVPTPTFSGSVIKDMCTIDKVIGAGEIAISDHRSSWPSFNELTSLVSDARDGGLLTEKAGVIHFHIGLAPIGLGPLFDIAEQTTLPITCMYPTHVCNRGPELLEQGKRFIGLGGYVDFTADGIYDDPDCASALEAYKNEGVPLDHVTVSSDCFGSYPVYEDGKLVRYGYMKPSSLMFTIRQLVEKFGWTLENAIQFSTKNPAEYLKFKTKGQLAVGMDADFVALGDRLDTHFVVARGQVMRTPTWLKKGLVEF